MAPLKKLPLWIYSLVLLASFLPAGPVFAQAGAGCSAGYSESNWMVVSCSPGFVTSSDRIKIFLEAGYDQARPWQDNLDYSNSTWIFDIGSQDRASLIIEFHEDSAGLVADIYDDGDGDGRVNYALQEGRPSVTENNGSWSLRLIARDGWWAKGAVVNFNLDLLVDDPLQAGFVEDVRLSLVEAGKVKTDGKVDFEIYVRDLDQDGRPDYEWRQNRYPLPEDPQVSGQVRTEIIANTEDDELLPAGYVFWPYISPDVGDYNKGRPGLPPIQVDWENASIVKVAEFIRARSEPGSYSIYSKVRVQEGQTTTVDFENPFAFYDLAGAGDGYPDLNIRFGVIRAHSVELSNKNITPLSNIQYAWDQTHTQHWDYQVGLAGRQAVEEVVRFPEFSVRAVPYTRLPQWVTEQTWDVATFVQVEKSPYYNSEIVWEWATFNGSDNGSEKYLAGVSDLPQVEDFSKIAVGFRGEYAFDYNSSPLLYFSPVDRKLHLLKAQAGIYQLDETRKIEYQNLGGAYLNLWTLLEDEEPVQSLFFDSGALIFMDAQGVRIARTAVPPAVFTALPPRTHAEWEELGQNLENNRPAFAPDDFQAMLDQFGGAGTTITGASLRDFRLIQGGFRFVINVQARFSVNSEDWLGLQGQPPGEYLVAYQDGRFQALPLTPASPALAPGSFQFAASPFALQPNRLTAVLLNQGLADAPSVTVNLNVLGPDGQPQVAAVQVVDLLSGENTKVSFAWTPPGPGLWEFSLSLGGEGGMALPLGDALVVQVPPLSPPGWRWVLEGFGAAHSAWAVAAFALALALLAALLVVQGVKDARR